MSRPIRIEHQGMHREYLTCFESVAITLLKSMGLEDEASLLGRYAFFAAAAEGLEISPRIRSLEQEWAEHLELVRHPARTPAELEDGIAAALGRGLPVCLPVDLHAWPHTPHFGKRRQRHYVAVFGVDGERYRVVCPYYAFEGEVDRQELHEGYLSPGSELGGLLTLEHLALAPLSAEEVGSLARRSCAYMLGSAVPESLAEVDPRLLGCAGIRTFAGRLEDLLEAHGENLPEVDGLVDLSRHLMAVGYARHWFSRLLVAHGTRLLPAGDGGVQRRLTEITQAWIAVGKRLAMGVHGRRAPLAADSLRRIARLAEQETDLFTALRDVLAGRRGAVQAVPAEESEPWPPRAPFVAPRGPEEEGIAGAYGDILELDGIGRDDDFFQLGGDSVLLIRLISRIREDFGVEVGFQAFFEAPTVAQLAARLRELERDGEPRNRRGPLAAGPPEDEPPLSFTQERFWFLEQMARGTNTFNMPFAVLLEGPLRPPVLEGCFAELLARHEVLRSTYTSRRGLPVQRIAPPARRALPLVDLTALAADDGERQRSRLANDNALRPFDLESGPLVRFALLRLAEERHVLLLAFHHIVADGGSLALLIREIQATYGAFLHARPSPLPALPVQYRDYARWQRDGLRGAALEAEIEHWRGELGQRPPVLVLPGQRRPLGPPRTRAVSRGLALRLASSLRWLGLRSGVTPFMLFLTAWGAVLGRFSGQTRVTVGTVTTGRDRAETEGLIGCFVNTLPLVVDLAGDASFGALLERVRRSTLTAFSHQELPFEKLVEAYNPDRRLQQPLFQAFFTLTTETPEPELEGLRLRVLPREEVGDLGAKFDLALGVKSSPDGTSLNVVYNAAIYPERLIEGLTGELLALLARVAEHPETPFSGLPGPSPDERRELEQSAVSTAATDAVGTDAASTDAASTDAVSTAAREAPAAPEEAGDERQQVRRRRSRLSRKLDQLPPALRARFEQRRRGTAPGAGSGAGEPSCLVTLQAGGARTPLFCVHAALGQVAGFTALGRHLGADQPLYGLQSPGLSSDDPGPRDLEGMAALYLAQLRAVQARGPYQVLGWSVGGIVAFEMARQLTAANEEVALLALVDTFPPRDSRRPLDEVRMLESFALHLGFDREQLPADDGAVRRLSAAERLAALGALGRELGVLPRDLDGVRLGRLWNVFQHNILANRAYGRKTWDGPSHDRPSRDRPGRDRPGRDRPGRARPGRDRPGRARPGRDRPGRARPTLLLKAREQRFEDVPGDLGWGELAGDLEVREVPGNHFTMIEEPLVGDLARILATRLGAGSAPADRAKRSRRPGALGRGKQTTGGPTGTELWTR